MTGKEKRWPFSGFQIGSLAAGILVAVGIETLIAGISWPLSVWISDAIQYVARVARLNLVGPGPVNYSPILLVYTIVTGIIVLLCGIRLGAWLSDGRVTKSSKSQ